MTDIALIVLVALTSVAVAYLLTRPGPPDGTA